MTIRDRVTAAAAELRDLDTAGLYNWAKSNGCDSRSGFSHFKKALAGIGVDYNAVRASGRADRAEALAGKAAAAVTLITDAKARTDRFAVCDGAGRPVWFGRFFDSDRDYDGEQSSGEMAAAKKAVWLAGKIREALGAEAIRLTLKVDAEWLTYANGVGGPGDNGKRGGKARALAEAARRANVVLAVEHIPGRDNPADAYTVCHGHKSWRDNDLAGLAA